MNRLSETQDGFSAVFKLSVPLDRADEVRRHLESLVALMRLPDDDFPVDTDDRPMAPGALLKQLRRERGLTQKAMAEKLGTTQTRISDMEQGVRTIGGDTAVKIAQVFGVPAGRFLQ